MKTLLLNTMSVVFDNFQRSREGWEDPKEMEGVIGNILEHLFECLKDLKIANETKAAAVRACGVAMSRFGDLFETEMQEFTDACELRLKDDIVPKATLKAIRKMAEKSKADTVDWKSFSTKLMPMMTPYIRKADRAIREETSRAIAAIISATGAAMPTAQFYEIVLNVSETDLIKATDPKMAENLFVLLHKMFSIPNIPQKVGDETMGLVKDKVTEFMKSPILSEASLEACNLFLRTFADSQSDATCTAMRKAFLTGMEEAKNTQVIVNNARCIATITVAQGQKQALAVVKSLVKNLSSEKNDNAIILLGEIGTQMSLVDIKGIENKFMDQIRKSKSPQKRKIAADALGLLVSGDLNNYMSGLLAAMTKAGGVERFVLTCSLQKTLQVCSTDPAKIQALELFVAKLQPLLMNQASTEDEGERKVIGECLGRLAIMNSDSAADLMKDIAKELGSAKAQEQRATMAIALKSAILHSTDDTSLTSAGVIEEIYESLEKEKSQITRTELMSCLNLILQRRVHLVSGDIGHIEKLVYPHCKTNADLVKKVQIGSMTHVIDDGLPQRANVFQIMNTLQKSSMFALNLEDYFKAIAFGFEDENEDIQARAFAITAHLAETRLKFIINYLSGMKGKMTSGAKKLLKKSKIQGAEGERAKDHTRVITNYLWKTRKAIPEKDEATCRDFCRFYIAITKTAQLKAYIDEFEATES